MARQVSRLILNKVDSLLIRYNLLNYEARVSQVYVCDSVVTGLRHFSLVLIVILWKTGLSRVSLWAYLGFDSTNNIIPHHRADEMILKFGRGNF